MSTGITEREQGEAASPGSDRHLRADAQRNRARILAAATTLMAVHGIDVPIDEIAQLAQVGAPRRMLTNPARRLSILCAT